jgi:phage terminase Nu1 subunit (DNA packaging protein)
MSELLSNRAAAQLVGCSHVAIGKAIKTGHLMALPGGGIDRAELERWNAGRRGARGGNPAPVSEKVSVHRQATAQLAQVAKAMADVGEGVDAEEVRATLNAQGIFLTRQEAELWRDSFVARSKQLAYEREAAKVIEVEHVAKIVSESLARVRTRLMAIPAEQAPRLHRLKTVNALQDALLECITEALKELVAEDAIAV